MQKEFCEKIKNIFEDLIASYTELENLLGQDIAKGIDDLIGQKYTKENAGAVMEAARAIEKFIEKINKIEYNLERVTDKTQIFLGSIEFNQTKLKQMPKELEIITGYAIFANSQITDLGQLQSIGGDAIFMESQITDLGRLQEIKGEIKIDKGSNLDFTKIKRGESGRIIEVE